MTTITLDEWQAELERLEAANAPDATAYTVRELAGILSRHEKAVQHELHRLIGAGLWECVMVYRKNIVGNPQRIPGYRPKGAV